MVGGEKAARWIPDAPTGFLETLYQQRDCRVVAERQIDRDAEILAAGQYRRAHFSQQNLFCKCLTAHLRGSTIGSLVFRAVIASQADRAKSSIRVSLFIRAVISSMAVCKCV